MTYIQYLKGEYDDTNHHVSQVKILCVFACVCMHVYDLMCACVCVCARACVRVCTCVLTIDVSTAPLIATNMSTKPALVINKEVIINARWTYTNTKGAWSTKNLANQISELTWNHSPFGIVGLKKEAKKIAVLAINGQAMIMRMPWALIRLGRCTVSNWLPPTNAEERKGL